MDSIIFDLDGTLWDSRNEVRYIWNKKLRELNIDRADITMEELGKTMGLVVPEIVDLLLDGYDDKTKNDFLVACAEEESQYLAKNGAILYDKLEETLIELSKTYKLFIVSNCRDGYIEAFYEYYNTEKYFQDCECPGRTGMRKADNIKLVVERNNLKAPIYVGDTQGDCNSAKQANVPFIWAKYGYGENLEGVEHEIENLSDLVDFMKILENK